MSSGIIENGVAVANRILMAEKLSSVSAWLFVEGVDDIVGLNSCFKKGIVKIVHAHSKGGVIDAVRHYLLNSKEKKQAVGIIDTDFDKILSKKVSDRSIFYVDDHDFLITAFKSTALETVLIHAKCSQNCNDIRKKIFDKARMPGIIRLINEAHGLGINLRTYALTFSDMKPGDAAKKLVAEALAGQVLAFDLNAEIEKESKVGHADDHLCQGHDVCKAMNADYMASSGNCSDLLMHAYGPQQFQETALFRDLEAFFDETGIEGALLKVA